MLKRILLERLTPTKQNIVLFLAIIAPHNSQFIHHTLLLSGLTYPLLSLRLSSLESMAGAGGGVC